MGEHRLPAGHSAQIRQLDAGELGAPCRAIRVESAGDVQFNEVWVGGDEIRPNIRAEIGGERGQGRERRAQQRLAQLHILPRVIVVVGERQRKVLELVQRWEDSIETSQYTRVHSLDVHNAKLADECEALGTGEERPSEIDEGSIGFDTNVAVQSGFGYGGEEVAH